MYMHAVSILKKAVAERKAVAYPGKRILDPETQRPYLTFVLMHTASHEELKRKYPSEVGEK